MTLNRLLLVICKLILFAVIVSGCGADNAQFDSDLSTDRHTTPFETHEYIYIDEPSTGTQEYEYLDEPAPLRTTALAGYFYFSSHKFDGTGADFSAGFFWDEAYFSNPASLYNPSLATMTLAFAMSAFASNDNAIGEATQARNAIDLLTQIGFSDIELNYYFTMAPHEDSMGVIAAHKTIEANGESYTLIAISTRGSGYGMEWAGNLTMGTEGYHEGFNRAAEETYRFIADYINRHRESLCDNIKLWITGYSRGAAVTNLFAAWVTQAEGIGDINVEKENIFTYTFASPRAVPAYKVEMHPVHTNIHNVLSTADLVGFIAPPAWGFGRYGIDHFIPERGLLGDPAAFDSILYFLYGLGADRAKAAVLSANGQPIHVTQTFRAARLGGINIIPPGVSMVYTNTLMSSFLLEITNNLAESVDQNEYAETVEGLVRAILALALVGEGRTDFVIDFFASNLLSILSLENALEIGLIFATDGMRGLGELAARYLYEGIVELEIDIDGPNFLEVLIDAITYIGPDNFLTFFYNIEALASVHHPEFVLAWLMSQDSNFGGTFTEFAPAYRKLNIYGPADVKVYDASGRLAAWFINSEPQDVESHIVSSVGATGEMIIYLPADMAYTVEITASGAGILYFTHMIFCFMLMEYSLYESWSEAFSAYGEAITVPIPIYAGNLDTEA